MSAPAILGISCFYHDSAAAMVCDGEIAAAVQEERFTRKKHDSRFPNQGIRYCLEHAGLTAKDLAAVAFYDNPMLSLERLLKTILHAAPDGTPQWLEAAPSFLGRKLFISRMIRSHLGIDAPILFARHHLSHAASAFYPSPFERAAILSVDGVG
jgi:carbamoyltransferase